MELLAIQFNHDPTSSSRSALNVRHNDTTFVTVPEWQRGQFERSVAAYAIRAVGRNRLTIRARLSSPEHAGRRMFVRARPTPLPPAMLAFNSSGVGPVALRASWDYEAGALGSAMARPVSFDAGGQAPFADFELTRPPLLDRGVGAYDVRWTWESSPDPAGPWTTITETRHRIYGLIDVPTLPWTQQPYSSTNSQLPWTEAMEFAAKWARGQQDPLAAAAAVTTSVYGLGSRIGYSCAFGAPANYSFQAFDCTAFLERLRGGFGNGRNVNCSDCATIVSTFANVLGADLSQSQMFNEWQPFAVNPAQLIGQLLFTTVCGTGVFNYHEVAWTGDCDVNDLVFDACLAGVDPRTGIVTVASGMRFGNVGERQYRQLLATPSGQFFCTPQPSTRTRRFVI